MSALAYFLTWTTYGTWLRGDARGSVVNDNRFGVPYAEPEPALVAGDSRRLESDAVFLGEEMRTTVHHAIASVCEHRGWVLHAANARSNHVHVVVGSTASAEKTLADLKAWATRALREAGLADATQKIWTRHGSTRHLFDQESLARAIDYVVRHQDMKGER
jgi:REP element-mobilizing transposase RayT